MAKVKAKQYAKEEAERAEKARIAEEEASTAAAQAKADAAAERRDTARKAQAEGDRAGVKVSCTMTSASAHIH